MASTARSEGLIGAKIGNYSIRSAIGQGGMGIVFRAEQAMIGKSVAIKILHADVAARDDAAARCFLEARAVNEIRHPNVVDILDCGVARVGELGDVHYLLMELLEGEPLRALISRGALPTDQATAIALEVGRALEAAHAKGIIHRDIKPENIFVDGRAVKVLDFGIAKLLDRAPGDRLTGGGVTLGTPQYMAPEQLDDEDLDGKVDVYALAIVLYEMVSGAVPFASETTSRGVWRRMNEVPALAAEVAATLPPGLEALLARALDPDRMRRPDMAELVRALADPTALAATGTGPHTVRLPKASRPAKPGRKKWLSAIPVAAVGIAIVAFAIAFFRTTDPPPPMPPADPVRVAEPPPRLDVVTISVTSVPSGADVFVAGESAPRGTTPLALALARSATAVEIRIVHAGYAELRRSLGVLRDDRIELALVELPKPRPAKPARPAVTPPPPPPIVVAPPPAIEPPPAKRPTGDNLLPPRKKP
ncbi:MAG: serine/threonine-protein kinase [Kofleriaceae bacterium]